MHKKRLDSWKAIADFLGRSLRTVQRWHELNGLPVHHFGGKKGSVFAYEEEIDEWLAGLAEASGKSRLPVEDALSTGRRLSSELTATAESMWETRSESNIQVIADLYRKAIDSDPQNGDAFAGLANAMVFSVMNDLIDASIAFPSAIEALRRIPNLDPERPQNLCARCSEAWIDLLYRHNWRQAKSGFEEIMRRQPTSFACSGLAAVHIAEGRVQDALEFAWEAWRISPLVRTLGGMLCWITYLSGDFQRAKDLVAQIRTSGGAGNLVHSIEALILVQEGPIRLNLERLEKSASDYPQNPTLQGCLAYAYGIAGEEDLARRKLAALARSVESARRNNGYVLALASLGLGERREAISWLETSGADGTLWGLGLRSDPILRSLKGDPRFERAIHKACSASAVTGFPERRSLSYLQSLFAVGER